MGYNIFVSSVILSLEAQFDKVNELRRTHDAYLCLHPRLRSDDKGSQGPADSSLFAACHDSKFPSIFDFTLFDGVNRRHELASTDFYIGYLSMTRRAVMRGLDPSQFQ